MQAEPTFRAAADLGYRLCSPERRVRVVEVVEQSSDTRHQVDAGPLSGDLEDTASGDLSPSLPGTPTYARTARLSSSPTMPK